MNALPTVTITLSVDPDITRNLALMLSSGESAIFRQRMKLRVLERTHDDLQCQDPDCEAMKLINSLKEVISGGEKLQAFMRKAFAEIKAAEAAIRESN